MDFPQILPLFKQKCGLLFSAKEAFMDFKLMYWFSNKFASAYVVQFDQFLSYH